MKNKKNSILFILLIISFIVIIVLVSLLIKLNNDKKNETKKLNELQSQLEIINSFNTGEYESEKASVTFDKKNFTVDLGESFTLYGDYNTDGNLVNCNITEYTFNGSEEVKSHEIDKNEKWVINFEIINDNSIKVKNVDLPDNETEIIITIFNVFQTDEIFILK